MAPIHRDVSSHEVQRGFFRVLSNEVTYWGLTMRAWAGSPTVAASGMPSVVWTLSARPAAPASAVPGAALAIGGDVVPVAVGAVGVVLGSLA